VSSFVWVSDEHYDLETFEKALSHLRADLVEMRSYAGCLGVIVLQDEADRTHICVIAEWESREHADIHHVWRYGELTTSARLKRAAPDFTSYCRRDDV
jgi:heme-degrading monooxygenase HmoA